MADFSQKAGSNKKTDRAVSNEELDRLAKIEADRLGKEYEERIKKLLEERKNKRRGLSSDSSLS